MIVSQGGMRQEVNKLLCQNGVKSLGYEDLDMSCADFARLKKDYPKISFLPLGQTIARQREIKDESELVHIAAAQAIADETFSHILKMISPNMTEIELAAEIEYYMKKKGAEDRAFDTICVSGSASSLPHGTPRDRVLERGFLTLDFGAKVAGYCSDMTRTVVLGKADSEMKKVYNTVLKANETALDAVFAGAKCRSVDTAAREIIDRAGYAGCFGHAVGHGVGLFIHEAPRLSQFSVEEQLSVGNVVTVEPGVYLEGKYGCRIEDIVAVRKDGFENFTKSTKEMIELF